MAGITLHAAQLLVLGVSYVGLGLGYLPGLRMNRATIALAGSAALIALGSLTLKQAWDAIDAATIVFLLSMMIVNANLAYSGFFELTLSQLIRLTRSPFGLLVVLSLGSGVLSALFLNDTIAIVLTPLTVRLVTALSLNPVPYLLAIAAASNTGSVATLSGNPQNILIGSFSNIAYRDFTQALLPVAIIGLVAQLGLLWWLYPEVRSLQPSTAYVALRPHLHRPLLIKSLVVTTGLLVGFVAGLPLAETALVAASVLLITRRIKPQRVLQDINWNVLVMFSGLFILSQCVQTLNLLQPVQTWLNQPLGLAVVTSLLSNLISNVPAVLLLQPLIAPDDTQAWLLLAASSTLAGNLTLFGSVANLIVAEATERLGYRLSFREHFRFGLPLSCVTIAIALIWLVTQF